VFDPVSEAEYVRTPEVDGLPAGTRAAPPSRAPQSTAGRIAGTERAFDLVSVLLLLPLLVPLAALIALVVFLDSPGSVFYRARRIGLGGRPFSMLKFRTMRADSEGPSLTRPDDDRFTPVGRFLAATRLDELPQVWHLLKGEMRLVGPRPEDPDFVRMFAHEYEEILSVPPGITGRTQLIYFGESASLDTADPLAHYAEQILPRKLELDAEYVRNRSLWLDLLIIGETLLLPLRLAADRVARAALGNHPHGAVMIAGAVLLLVAFAVAGGSAR